MLTSKQIASKLGFLKSADEMPAPNVGAAPNDDKAGAELPPLPDADPAGPGQRPPDKIERLRLALLAAVDEESDEATEIG